MSTDFDRPHPNGSANGSANGSTNGSGNGSGSGAGTVVEEPNRPTWRRWLVLGVLIVVAMLWTIAILYSVTRNSPEDLDDGALAELASACDETRAALESRPDLPDEATAAEVIELTRDENEVFVALIGRIEAIRTSGDEAQRALDAWVEDWRALLAARAAFADDLEDDGTARFELPTVTRGGLEPISDRMEEYATGRGLDQCTPFALQAEVVDVRRDYTLGDPD